MAVSDVDAEVSVAVDDWRERLCEKFHLSSPHLRILCLQLAIAGNWHRAEDVPSWAAIGPISIACSALVATQGMLDEAQKLVAGLQARTLKDSERLEYVTEKLRCNGVELELDPTRVRPDLRFATRLLKHQRCSAIFYHAANQLREARTDG